MNKPSTIIDMVEKNGVFEQDAIYSQLVMDQGEVANSVLFNNGVKVLFASDFFKGMVACRVSYDYGKTFNPVEEWHNDGFNSYVAKLKSMTSEEVLKRTK